MRKHLLLLFLLCTCSFLVKAQDHIHLKDGNVLDVYVKKITGTVIFYSSSPGSPKRYIRRSAVEKVVYKRGKEMMMETPQSRRAEQRKGSMLNYHNLLTLSPLPLMFWGNYSGVGIGFDYERYVDKEHHLISLHLGGYVGYITDEGDDLEEHPYNKAVVAYATPGLRIHPFNPQKRIDYAVGVSGIIGNANHTANNYSLGIPDVDEQFLLTGVTLDNDINFTGKRKKFVIGAHIAVGPVFGDFSKNDKWMVQIGLKLGGRF